MAKLLQLWWLTRPVRSPVALDLTVKIFAQIAENRVWQRNRSLQKELEKKLAEAGIKRDRVSLDGSGGRTWAALLRYYGFWYPSSEEGKVILTHSAEALIRGDRVRQHIRKQILNYQIPNAYLLYGAFRFRPHSDFKIFPFRFLLILLLDRTLDHYLTSDEIALLVITAKTAAEYERVKNQILYYRKQYQKDSIPLKKRISLITSLQKQYDHRQRINAHRDPQGYLSFTRDIATTFTINLRYLEGAKQGRAGIYLEERYIGRLQNLLKEFELKYPFNSKFKISESAFAGHYGLDLDRYKYTKDLGPPVITPGKKIDLKISNALEEIFRSQPSPQLNKLLGDIKIKTGFADSQIKHSLKRIHPELGVQGELTLNSRFIEAYLSTAEDGSKWREFEDMTAVVFKEIGFKVRRDQAVNGEKIEIILLDPQTEQLGIVDCKAGRKFILSSKDRSLMASVYISYFMKYSAEGNLFEPHRPYKLVFFLYVVNKFASQQTLIQKISATARRITGKEINGSAVEAPELLLLLDLCKKEGCDLKKIIKLFQLGRAITSKDIKDTAGAPS